MCLIPFLNYRLFLKWQIYNIISKRQTYLVPLLFYSMMINLPCTFSKLQTYHVPSLFYSATINLTCAFLNDKLTLYLSSLQYNNLASTFSKWQTYLIPFLFYNFKLISLIACEINISKRVQWHATRELFRHVIFLLSLFCKELQGIHDSNVVGPYIHSAPLKPNVAI